VIVNGTVAHLDLAADGIEVGLLDDEGSFAPLTAENPPDVFAVMNEAFTSAPIHVRVARGAVIDAPIVVAQWSDQAGLATFPRLVVEAGENSQASVVDYHASADDAELLTIPVVELVVGRAARLGFVGAQNLGLRTWQIGSQVSSVDADATFTSATAGFGGDYARVRTDCRLVGRGATGNLLAVYFGERDQTLDFRTFQDHSAPDTTSNLLFKGAVGGRSRSVYTGLIRVRKNARGTNAFQTNRNIKLSDDAWAESVPNLEIENNDVRCSHASAVGPVDEDQRFYLESRGVPTAVAERLVVTGFFDEVLAQLPVPDAAVALRSLVGGKLDRTVA
jgi:Fe-S cluster assembly protein SufD